MLLLRLLVEHLELLTLLIVGFVLFLYLDFQDADLLLQLLGPALFTLQLICFLFFLFIIL